MVIERLKKFTYKSYKKYNGPEKNQVFNKRKNIIFGSNGRGKSSLCKGLLDQYEQLNPDVSIEETVRYFNRDYVKDNLLIKDETDKEEHIKGVVANFGKANVDIENKIEEYEAKKETTTNLEKERNAIGQDIVDEISKIFESKKGNSKIRSYVKNINLQDSFKTYLDKYKNDYKCALGKASEEEIKNYKSVEDIQRLRDVVENITIPTVDKVKTNLSNEIAQILRKEYSNLSIPSSEIVKWMKEGLTLHKDGDKCQFCGGDINLSNINKKVNEYSSSQREKDVKKLEGMRDRLKGYVSAITNFYSRNEYISSNIKEIEVDDWNNLNNLLSQISQCLSQIESKIKNFDTIINIDDTYLEDITNSLSEALTKFSNLKKNQLKKLDDQIKNDTILLKGSIASEVINNPLINNKYQQHETAIRKIQEVDKTNQQIDKDIQTLRKKKNNISDFMEDFNDILKRLNIDLKFELKGDSYLMKHAKEGIVLKMDDISEGEKNLLSLLYFYCELFADKEKNKVKDSISLIIIDDPISSLDNTNRIFILQLIKDICAKTGVKTQVFVLTHSWDDFSNIFSAYKEVKTNGKDKEYIYSFWEIVKEDEKSKIYKIDNNSILATPYEHAFKEINDAVNNPKLSRESTIKNGIYHLPNLMRCVLEEFLSFKTDKSTPNIGNSTEITRVLCGENPSSNDKLMVERLVAVCNILSHTFPDDPEEIYEAAKFLMERIKEVDSNHYHKMIK